MGNPPRLLGSYQKLNVTQSTIQFLDHFKAQQVVMTNFLKWIKSIWERVTAFPSILQKRVEGGPAETWVSLKKLKISQSTNQFLHFKAQQKAEKNLETKKPRE